MKKIFRVFLLAMITLLIVCISFGLPAWASAEGAAELQTSTPLDLLGIVQQYAVIPVTVVCLVVGGLLKNAFPAFNNNFIPLALFPVGFVGVLWMHGWALTPDTFFAGFCSAALAVYLHSGGKHILNFIHEKQEETKPPEP